jgi:hypothetical protein
MDILDSNDARGFTKWTLTEGRGSINGEPHFGSHAWPSMNSSLLAIVADETVEIILSELRELDKETKMQGSRAFVWNIEQTT